MFRIMFPPQNILFFAYGYMKTGLYVLLKIIINKIKLSLWYKSNIYEMMKSVNN